MMMSLERAAIMGRLAEAKQRQARLTLLIDGYCGTIRTGLNTALTPVADLEIAHLAAQWEAMEAAWGELQVVRGEIDRLQRGLT